MTEKIIIKLTISGNSDGISIQTARWLQSNRNQAIAAIQESFKPEIAAYSEASNEDIIEARLEALSYHEYRVNVLRRQLAHHQLSPTNQSIDPPEVTLNGSSTNVNSTNGDSTNGSSTNIAPKSNPLDTL